MVLVLHCFSLCDHCSFFFFFSFLSLGFALHNIHAFHSRCFYSKKKRKEKEANCVFALFSLFLKTRLVNLFSHDIFFVLCLALKSSFIAFD